MPHPAKTDLSAIVETAGKMIERSGVEQLSLAQLADALGVRAPSLYRHVDSKAALLRAVNEHTLRALFAAFERATRKAGDDPRARLWAVFHAQRAFAHAHPATYVLAFTTSEPGSRGDEAALVTAVLPLQTLMASIAGPEHALPALRGALALVHGFVMLELNRQFQRGGDLDAAFDAAVGAYLRGWERDKR